MEPLMQLWLYNRAYFCKSAQTVVSLKPDIKEIPPRLSPAGRPDVVHQVGLIRIKAEKIQSWLLIRVFEMLLQLDILLLSRTRHGLNSALGKLLTEKSKTKGNDHNKRMLHFASFLFDQYWMHHVWNGKLHDSRQKWPWWNLPGSPQKPLTLIMQSRSHFQPPCLFLTGRSWLRLS